MDTNQFEAPAIAQMECMIQDLGHLYRARNRALQEVTAAHHEALFRLALAAEFRDTDTGTHIVRMGFLAEALALAAGQSRAWSSMLRKAAPMHDVGKIGIPDAVLKKPGGFTPDERTIMNRHAEIGAQILGRSGSPLFTLAAEVALSHHERWDGRGYPGGLAGADIPLSGRIVAIVDCFDALTMDRCYRPAFDDAQAIQLLRHQRGAAYDPELLDLFEQELPRMVALRDAVNRTAPSFAELVEGVPELADAPSRAPLSAPPPAPSTPATGAGRRLETCQ